MSDKPKFPRSAALDVARDLCNALRPVTSRLIVAGSLRRRKDQVGDVEILYIPRTAPVRLDFFSDPVQVDQSADKLQELLKSGILAKRQNVKGGTAWGEKNKLAVHKASGIPVDLFAASEENWWSLVVCRTGSKETNHRIATAALQLGFTWAMYRGKFYSVAPDGTPLHSPAPVPITSEQDVFTFCGLPYLDPWQR